MSSGTNLLLLTAVVVTIAWVIRRYEQAAKWRSWLVRLRRLHDAQRQD